MNRKEELQNNLTKLNNHIRSLSQRPFTLVAVSKYSKFSDIELLYKLGHRDFGENRIEDLEKKSSLAIEKGLDEIRWHFIGRVQSNKIKRIVSVKNLALVHSISNLKHLKLFDKEASLLNEPLAICLQVNCSDEEHKDGFVKINNELLQVLNDVTSLDLCGLMTMAENRNSAGDRTVSESFTKLKSIRDSNFPSGKLSMGMSGDYDLALKAGADIIRVGSAIFKN